MQSKTPTPISTSTPVHIILGPTASGKTELALKLAQRTNAVVVSADSRQLYTHFNLGAAKPKGAWRTIPHNPQEPDIVATINHYLLNIATPTAPLTLAHWLQHAQKITKDSYKKNIPVIIAGGTMLYLDAFIFNYDLPHVPPNQKLRNRLEQQSVAALYEAVQDQDPAAATLIGPHNKRRLIRALEVIQATGLPFSASRRQQTNPYPCKLIGLKPTAENLTNAIQTRNQTIISKELQTETQHIISEFGADLPLLETLNYRHIMPVISGQASLEMARRQADRDTLRYAKRQLSWWRRPHYVQGGLPIHWFENPTDALAQLPL